MGKKSHSFLWNCFLAAVCGTCGATGAKLAFSSNYLQDILGTMCVSLDHHLQIPNGIQQCTRFTSAALSIVQAIVVMTINTKGLQYVLKAMHLTNTAIAVLCNSAIAFVMSGFIGYFLFNEDIDFKWCVGIVMVLVGVWLLNDDDTHTHKKKEKLTQSPMVVITPPTETPPPQPSQSPIVDKNTLAFPSQTSTVRVRANKPPPSPLHIARSSPNIEPFTNNLSPLTEKEKESHKFGGICVCLAALLTGVLPKNTQKQRKKRSIAMMMFSGMLLVSSLLMIVRVLTVRVDPEISNKM